MEYDSTAPRNPELEQEYWDVCEAIEELATEVTNITELMWRAQKLRNHILNELGYMPKRSEVA